MRRMSRKKLYRLPTARLFHIDPEIDALLRVEACFGHQFQSEQIGLAFL